jgi:hypothetical protein
MIAGYVLVAIVGAGLIIGTNTVQVGYSGWGARATVIVGLQ